MVSGIGWDKVDPDNPGVPVRQRVSRGVETSGCSTSTAPTITMRALSLHPGIEPDQVPGEHLLRGRTGWMAPSTTRLATADELKLLREVIDPKSLRDKEVRV